MSVNRLITAAKRLRDRCEQIPIDPPVTHTYNPLVYAWSAHQRYLKRANPSPGGVVFLGMNPGPWGMAQTGVPFGEVEAVRNWIGIDVAVDKPADEHPKRPIDGFACNRSEVSGRRLWGLMRDRFKTAEAFFADHFVVNYCPLVFMEASGRNRTPDKLSVDERVMINDACDAHLAQTLKILRPGHVVGVGAYAEACLTRVIEIAGVDTNRSRILHPSPASPAANRDWAGTATRQLIEAGVWR